MDRVEAQRRLINLENTLVVRSLAFSPVRDPAVEQARFPNLIATYWGLVDHNVCKEVSPPRVPAPDARVDTESLMSS